MVIPPIQLPMRLQKIPSTGFSGTRVQKLGHNQSILNRYLRFISIELIYMVDKPVKNILSLKVLKVFYLLSNLGLDIKLGTLLIDDVKDLAALFYSLGKE